MKTSIMFGAIGVGVLAIAAGLSSFVDMTDYAALDKKAALEEQALSAAQLPSAIACYDAANRRFDEPHPKIAAHICGCHIREIEKYASPLHQVMRDLVVVGFDVSSKSQDAGERARLIKTTLTTKDSYQALEPAQINAAQAGVRRITKLCSARTKAVLTSLK